MKILILSASIGSGHMQAAEAINEALEGKAEIIDFMSKETSTLNWLLKKLYLSALGLIPDLYDRIYRLAGVRRFGSITRWIWSTLMYLPFSRLLNKVDPDVIICTHPFPEAAATLWKFLHPGSAKRFTLAAVLTDYSLHEIWIYNGVDLYFVATEEMKAELERHGNYKVFATGIPIRSQFKEVQKNFAFRLPPSALDFPHPSPCNTVAPNNSAFRIPNSALIMGGGLGLGAFEETIKNLDSLDTRIRIIVVTGNNQSLKAKLEALKTKHELVILGFVDNIAELMQSADILISKPGGLTLSEAFTAGLPILLLPPIPGPEALNAEYAVKQDAALSLSRPSDIADAIKILNNPDKLKAMGLASRSLARPHAARLIADLIMNG